MSTLYTPEEIADQLRVHRYTIYRAIRRGELEARRAGRQIRITPEAVEAYTKPKTTKVPQEASR